MSPAEIGEYVGYLAAAYCIGFAGGYTFTTFIRAVNNI